LAGLAVSIATGTIDGVDEIANKLNREVDQRKLLDEARCSADHSSRARLLRPKSCKISCFRMHQDERYLIY